MRKQQHRLIFHFITKELLAVEERVKSVLEQMEKGFTVDVTKLTDFNKTNEESISTLNKEIQKKLGTVIRPNSSTDLAEFLFGHSSLPSLRRTPAGNPSASIEVLERLEERYGKTVPFLKPLIEFKKAQAIAKAIKVVFKKLTIDGRIHPEFNPFTCPTGRIYSYIQNLPKQIRKVLIPDAEENVFIELDWSQQELRILGALSQEPVFLDCFAKEEDLHKRVISKMCHKSISEVTDEERMVGKTINYALIYGQEAPGLAWNLNIPLKKAQELIDQYFFSLPMIQKFKDESREKFLTEGCAETVFGRKTRLNLTGPHKEKELRRGFNHIIQGTGADILRMTLVRLNEALTGGKAKLKFCAHDAIYVEAKKEVSEEIGELARSIMEIDFMGVHLPVTMKIHHDFSMGEGSH